jgi:hypothetical protein
MAVTATIKTAACRAAYYSRALDAAMRLREPRGHMVRDGQFQILVYHRVADDGDPFVPTTPVQTFARHAA